MRLQQKASTALKQLQLHLRPLPHHPDIRSESAATPLEAARNFLRANRGLLRIDDPDRELVPVAASATLVVEPTAGGVVVVAPAPRSSSSPHATSASSASSAGARCRRIS